MYGSVCVFVTERNQNYAFPNELMGSNPNRPANASSGVLQGGNVSFPVIHSLHNPQNTFIISHDIPSLQSVGGVESGLQLYPGIMNQPPPAHEYQPHRHPQRPCKRQRRFACHFLGCDRSFDSQWSLER